MATDREFTRILDWPGYRVYQHEIDEKAKTLKLWIRRKRGNRRLECAGCGRKFTQIYDTGERAVRELLLQLAAPGTARADLPRRCLWKCIGSTVRTAE